MDDGLDSSMDTGADDSEVTSYSADDIAELAAAAQEVLDAPPEDLPEEDAPAAEEAAPEPVAAPVAEPTPEPATPPAPPAATPVAAKGGCATLLVGICCVVALVALLLV